MMAEPSTAGGSQFEKKCSPRCPAGAPQGILKVLKKTSIAAEKYSQSTPPGPRVKRSTPLSLPWTRSGPRVIKKSSKDIKKYSPGTGQVPGSRKVHVLSCSGAPALHRVPGEYFLVSFELFLITFGPLLVQGSDGGVLLLTRDPGGVLWEYFLAMGGGLFEYFQNPLGATWGTSWGVLFSNWDPPAVEGSAIIRIGPTPSR